MRILALLGLLAFVVGACGRSPLEEVHRKTVVAVGAGGSPGGATGVVSSGGALGTGGARGTGGAGGQAGSPGETYCPSCIADVVARCLPAGACRESGGGSASDYVTSACFENGVKIASSKRVDGSHVYIVLAVSKNGQPCYSMTTESDSNMPTSVLILDEANHVIAQGSTDSAGNRWIYCGTYRRDVGDFCGGINRFSSCTPGDCP